MKPYFNVYTLKGSMSEASSAPSRSVTKPFTADNDAGDMDPAILCHVAGAQTKLI